MEAKHGISRISRVILQYMEENGDGLDAETLWLELRKHGHRMCVCSVYINLKKLEKMKRLQKTQAADRKYVFALTK